LCGKKEFTLSDAFLPDCQDIPWNDLVYNYPYALKNPLRNNQNKERILKYNFPMKIDKDKDKSNKKVTKKIRPSPSVSAKDFQGKKKKGNDGNFWISTPNKNNIWRWVKC